jgi:hypothetical protein
MSKNNILLGLIAVTGLLFISAIFTETIELASKLGGTGVITGISALFVKGLLKENNNG